MKKWSLILAIFVLTALYAAVSLATETDEKELGFWVEVQKPSGKPARAILWFERDVTEQFGFFAFAWNESDGYREYLAGPTWKPFKGLQLGLGFGHETIPGEGSGARRIFLLDATKDDINVYVAFERGRASGPWKKITATYALSERFGVPSDDGVLIDLKLTNDDLAAIAGVSRQFTNSTLQDLRKRGLIAGEALQKLINMVKDAKKVRE